MLFNSYEFIFLFLPVTFLGFFRLAKHYGQRVAILWLTLASFFFYGWWDFLYVPLLFASIAFNYAVGKYIETAAHGKGWLTLGIICNVLLLCVFKYTDFFLDTVNTLSGSALPLPHIVLPLGISFFTFTQTAYLVDVYRRQTKNDTFLTYCEFVTIFPHLIAGPIINHKEMMPQFMAAKNFVIDYRNVAMGLCLFTMGLFKKVVVADKLSPWVADVFSRADSLTFLEAWIGAIGYTFQLYFDFSGYSEMALGLGLLFNLKLPVNFNSPYQATSMIDFWRRWHMTLGLWVRDYLYIPLGGNRHGEFKKMRNLFVSMLIIGLWHGAGYTFVFWGGLHGVFLMINHQWRRLNIALPKAVNWSLTSLCVMVCWVFFRAENFGEALNVLKAMGDVGSMALPAGGSYEKYLGFLRNWGVNFIPWVMTVSLVKIIKTLFVLLVVLVICPNPQRLMKHFKPNAIWLLLMAIAFVYAIWHVNNYSEFLYFQF
ncbi:MAG: MBOAT family protein [Selenomonadaceae bacterium]|nr:MBOAT family protein [Selenomonadaceae bacterium]